MNKARPTYEELEKMISDLEAENAKLSQSTLLFQSIFDKLPFGLQIFDKSGLSYKINQAQKNILRLLNADKGIGKFNVLTDPYSIASGMNKLFEQAFNGQEYSHEIEYDRGSQKNQWNTKKDKVIFSETIFPVFNSNNQPEYVVSLLNDITELNRAKQQLLSDQKKLNQKNDELQAQNKELQIAKEKTEESENQFKLLVENAPEPIFIQIDQKFEYLNKAALNLFGANTEEELIGNQFVERIHPDFAEIAKQKMELLNENSLSVSSFECKHIKLDNTIIEVEVSAVPIRFNNKKGSLVFVKDITERRRIENEIIQRNAEIENYFNCTIDLLCIANKDGYFLRLNKEWENVLGYTLTELENTKFFDLIHPDDIEPTQQVITQLSNNINITNFTNRYRCKNGEYKWIEWKSYPYGDKIYAAARDITERKRIEKELSHSYDLMRYIIEHNRSAVAVLDKNLNYVYVSQRYIHDYKINKKDIIGKYHYDIFPNLPNKWKEVHQKALNGHISSNEEEAFENENGTIEWTRWECRPWYEANGSIGGIILYTEVITERKKIEAALIQKNSELEASEEKIRATNEELIATANALKKSFTELQIAKEKTEESEENLHEAQRIAKVGNWYLNLQNSELTWSKSCYLLFEINEYISTEDLKLKFNQLIFPEDLVTLKQMQEDAIKRKESFSLEYRINLNNNIKTILSIAEPVIDDHNQLIAFKGIIQDITERKQFEEKLQQSYNLLNNLTAQVPGVVYQYRLYPDGRSAFPYSSPGMSDIYEVTSEEVREDASPVFTRLHPDDLQYIVETITESARNQTIYQSEFRVVLPRQGIRWRHCDAKPELLEDGSTLWHGIIIDITERKQAEEKIKEQQLLFETMFNTISDGVIITDTEHKILLANKGMLTTFGYSPEEIVGKSTEILYAANDNFFKIGEEVFNEQSLSSDSFYMTIYADKFKNIFSGETFGAKLYDSSGKWIGNLGIIRNISERIKYIEELKVAREKAEESDRLKTAFLNNISHEIRTPMNGIVGFSGFLNDPNLQPEKRIHFTDMIVQSSNQLLSIITDIISIATIEAGQEQIFEMEIKLNSSFKFLFAQFIGMAEKKNVSLRFETSLKDDEDKIITDKTKLECILTNLVGNALKFTNKGYINFGYRIKDSFLEFYIEDTGIGISADMHQEIFKRFRQVEITASRKFGGSGLGLSISKSYVEMLGGKIWLTSELGKGSVFNFTIPYKKPATADVSVNRTSESIPTPKTPLTLLIAEDEESNFILLESLLSNMEIRIIRALNGIEAVNICKTNPQIDIVLMDIKMPEMDGLEATRQIKAMNPNLPVIAQTAYSFPEEKNQALMAGCNMFLSKPIKKIELLQAISQVIEK